MIRSGVIFCLLIVLISTNVSCRSSHSRQRESSSSQQPQQDNKFFTRFIATKSIKQVLSEQLYRVDIAQSKSPQILTGYLTGDSFAESPDTVTFVHTLYSNNETKKETKDARLLKSLSQSAGFHSSVSKRPGKDALIIFCWVSRELDAIPHAYVYLPKSGELGRGTEWCYVPAEFKVWISRLIKSKEIPEPKAIHLDA